MNYDWEKGGERGKKGKVGGREGGGEGRKTN
jgi:hypothetical protein